MSGPMSLECEEQRFFADLATAALASKLAFFRVVDVVCIGSFCGALEPAIDIADLLPVVWDPRHRRHQVEFREDVIPVDGSGFLDLPCSDALQSLDDAPRLRGSVADVLETWRGRCGAPIQIQCAWQVWPHIATLLCHRAWSSLAWVGGHASVSVLVPAGQPSAPCAGSSDADMTSDKFAELGTALQTWCKAISFPGLVVAQDITCSEAYFAGWAEWADGCEKSLNVRDSFFSSRRIQLVISHIPHRARLERHNANDDVELGRRIVNQKWFTIRRTTSTSTLG